jgi:hypothetical protein
MRLVYELLNTSLDTVNASCFSIGSNYFQLLKPEFTLRYLQHIGYGDLLLFYYDVGLNNVGNLTHYLMFKYHYEYYVLLNGLLNTNVVLQSV